MGKDRELKYYIISGLDLNDNNRGTAALGYGAFPFLKDKHKTEGLTALRLFSYKKPWKFSFRECKREKICVACEEVELHTFYLWFVDLWVYQNIPLFSRFTKTARVLQKVSYVAAINGGDGFSDIYGTRTFESRLFDIELAMSGNIPLIMLPQTLGSFKEATNYVTAERILKYASRVFVRDLKFEPELKKMGVQYELTKDLSYYMKPEKVDIDILPSAVGINVSGLCYSNTFRGLSGYFETYPQLISCIINYFQKKNVPIYLISHSYNYKNPEEANDDMQASREVYEKLKSKRNVYLIDRDLTAPQTKYVISQLKFFVGTRMHANYAAIFTNTPVFGLAYSYKYEGSFDYMGLKGHYANVLNIQGSDIRAIVMKINEKYIESCYQ